MKQIENMSKKMRPIVGKIVEAVRDAEEVEPQALAKMLGYPYDIAFRRAWASANVCLKADGGGFRPIGSGRYVPATTEHKIRQALRRNQAAARVVARQVVAIEGSDPSQLPESERPMFEKFRERTRLIGASAIAMLTTRKELPQLPEIQLPALPRGR